MIGLFGPDFGARAAVPEEASWRLWLAPRFLHSAGGLAIANAKRTDLAVGFLDSLGYETWPAGESLPGGWVARAKENAANDLAQVTVSFHRNRKKVIEYAELKCANGVMASAVLAPKFLDLFADTLGPTVLVVVPNPKVAYVFPKLASNYQDYGPVVYEAYRGDASRISLEIFEVDAEGWKAIGAFPDPARD